MATEDRSLASRRSSGTGVPQPVVSRLVTFTVNGNSTVADTSITLPVGSVLHSIVLDTPTAISGTPTSCMFRCGTASAGQQVVADVDGKAQGHITATIVAGFDKVGGFSAADVPLFLQVVTTGGTSSAGTIEALVTYAAPVY